MSKMSADDVVFEEDEDVFCPADVVAGALITKEKRHELFGEKTGGAGSTAHENFARRKITEGTKLACPKTKVRINLRTHTLKEISNPNTYTDGFDYSEDFDGLQKIGSNNIYVNFKCVVGAGGAQTRSLREVYWFVEGQLNTLKKSSAANLYFANILDGDVAHAAKNKFEYMLALPEFAHLRSKIYVGDLKGYFAWFKSTFPSESK